MTQQTTQEFIAARSKMILKQINDLRQELAALRNLKSTLSGKSVDSSPKSPQNRLNMTFQDMIVDVLNDQPSHSAEALQIIDLIKEKHGKTILRSSISPQLSRLKAKSVLELNNNVWSLTDAYKAKKNKAPEVGASTDGVDAPSINSGATQTDKQTVDPLS